MDASKSGTSGKALPTIDRAFLEGLGHGIAIFDSDHRLALFNDRYKELLGLPGNIVREDASYLKIVQSMDEHAAPGAARTPLETKLAGEPQRMVLSRNGTVLEERLRPLSDGGFIVTCADVTETRASRRSWNATSRITRSSPTS